MRVENVAASGMFDPDLPPRFRDVLHQLRPIHDVQANQARAKPAKTYENAGREENNAVVGGETF